MNALESARVRLSNAIAERVPHLTLCFIDVRRERLVVGVRAVTREARQVARDLAGRRTPLDVIAFRAERHANKTAFNRPIFGGIAVQCRETGGAGFGTIGIYATAGATDGFVTAGHVVGATGVTVYQPRFSDRNDWSVGIVSAVSNYTGVANSDSAYVARNPAVAVTRNAIWLTSSSTYSVQGTIPPSIGDAVSMQGATTATTERNGVIVATGVTVTFEDGGVLNNQLIASYATKQGDSGAPVYTKIGGANVLLVGLNIGAATAEDITPHPRAGTYAVISPWAYVAADLQVTL